MRAFLSHSGAPVILELDGGGIAFLHPQTGWSLYSGCMTVEELAREHYLTESLDPKVIGTIAGCWAEDGPS